MLAGEASFYLAQSLDRGGRLDSAIAACERAVTLRGNHEDRLMLADLRLRRETRADAAAVLRDLTPTLGEMGGETERSRVQVLSRIAWAYVLSGRPDSAAILFSGMDEFLGGRLEWRYRMAKAALMTGDARRTFDLLLPVAIASRMQDEDVMIDLKEAAEKIGVSNIEQALRREMNDRDAREQRMVESWGGRRVTFRGTDGFPLVGFALAPAGTARRTGAVVLMALGDSLPAYDSLATAMRRRGVAVILVPPRGTSWAVSPACPLADAWVGREEDLQRQTARDVRRALRALAATTRIDTTRYVVVGVASSATIAAQAARIDPQVRALLMVSPTPAMVDRGPACAALAAARPPVFFQVAPEDFGATLEVTDLLYQATNRSASRVVEAKSAGRGVAQFRADPTLAKRFLDWLDGALKVSPTRATPP